jgi:alginate O-acetyltransferase complex protein AlgI
MLGLGAAGSGAALIGGVIYQPYYLVALVAGCWIVWFTPQTWDLTRRMTWPKVALVLGAIALAVLALTTQSFNPFIYFIF